MTLPWVLLALTISCLVATATAASARVAALAGRPQRWIWLAGAVGIAFLTLWPGTSSALEGVLPSLGPASVRDYADHVQNRLASDTVVSYETLRAAFLWAWALGSLLLFSVFCWTQLRLRGMTRSHPVQVSGIRVHLTDDLGPAVVGIFDRRIVLPRWLLRLPPQELNLVLAHEDEHVRAADTALLSAGALLTVLIPWNPCLWWLHRRLRLAVELDCDSRVLRRGVDSRVYGAVLLQLACQSPLLPASTPGFFQNRHSLSRRIAALAQPHAPHARVRALFFGVVAAYALLFAFEVTAWRNPGTGALPAPSAESPRQPPASMGLVPLRTQTAPAETPAVPSR